MNRPALRARLVAVASYLPQGQLTNEMLVREFPDWTPEQISDKTGIHSRHMAAAGEFTSDIAVKAAERLFAERAGLRREDIDFIMLMTVSPDYLLPFTAGIIQSRLGIPARAGALDSTLGCSGYVYGVGLAAALAESGRAKRILLLTGDRFTAYTEQGDRSVKALMGDAGTASLIEAVDEEEAGRPGRGGLIGATDYGTDGSGAMNLVIRTSAMRGFLGDERVQATQPTFEMNGPEVFNFTLGTIGKHLTGFLSDNGLTVDDVHLFIFHQANVFMLQHLRRKLGIREDRFAIHMASVGNTSSSTIPLALDAALRAGRIGPGSRIVLTGFGVGYSWGSVLVEYPG
jgi:3-oxoacyl-[acyl-carrier-protein] synthase-3